MKKYIITTVIFILAALIYYWISQYHNQITVTVVTHEECLREHGYVKPTEDMFVGLVDTDVRVYLSPNDMPCVGGYVRRSAFGGSQYVMFEANSINIEVIAHEATHIALNRDTEKALKNGDEEILAGRVGKITEELIYLLAGMEHE